MAKKRVVIVGASGMVGGHALAYALAHPDIDAVTSIGRRTLDIDHPKLKQVVHRDFADCAPLAEVLSGQDAAVFCLGAYTGAVSDVELRKTSWDYPVAFARVLREASPAARFGFLSGMGADPSGRSRAAFARYKGGAEKDLQALGFNGLCIFRPAYIYPVQPRVEPNFSYRLLRFVYPVFRWIFPGAEISSHELAEAMVDTVLVGQANDTRVLENRDIQAIARVSKAHGLKG